MYSIGYESLTNKQRPFDVHQSSVFDVSLFIRRKPSEFSNEGKKIT